MTREKFLQLLFDEREQTCFTEGPTGTSVSKAPGPKDLFFAINALDPAKDNDPIEAWHSPTKPRRCDANVITHRNFLIELDNVPITEQMPYILGKTKVSAITFSGNKSYHFIISLQEPVSADEYAKIAAGFLRLFPQADKTCKNPSRLSRLPGAVRPDTRLLQELVYLGTRISKAELPEFPPSKHSYEREKPKDVLYVTSQLQEVLNIGVDNYISFRFSGRNQFFYWLGKRLSELNHDRATKKQLVEYYYNKLENKHKFSIKEAYMAARVKV